MSSDLCPHFGECGGCQNQDVPYPEQLARKEGGLRRLFRSFWDGPIPVEPSPVIWRYRNRLDFHFAPKRYPEPPPKDFVRETVLGFKRKGRWYWPMEVAECRIGPAEAAALLATVRTWVRGRGLRAFDSRTRQGFLRILLVREGKRTGQRMVVLITRDGALDKGSFVEAVRSSYPADCVYRAVFRGLADVAHADELELLYGAPTIDEALFVPDDDRARELRFRLSPFSFFQTNTLATERLYGVVRDWVKTVAPKTLYDLYGGSAGIGLACADLVQRVVSVESARTATEDAVCNAQLNGVDNVAFITQRVEDYLRDLGQGEGMDPDCAVVLDPPRPGLHPKALRRLAELRPQHVCYLSCKPSVLARELPALMEVYTLKELRAIDLFPHTDHVEALAKLSRRA